MYPANALSTDRGKQGGVVTVLPAPTSPLHGPSCDKAVSTEELTSAFRATPCPYFPRVLSFTADGVPHPVCSILLTPPPPFTTLHVARSCQKYPFTASPASSTFLCCVSQWRCPSETLKSMDAFVWPLNEEYFTRYLISHSLTSARWSTLLEISTKYFLFLHNTYGLCR